jgi:hypothetical protein
MMQLMLKDWAFAHAAVEDLQAYLLSRELYWPLSPQKEERAAGQLLTLTPGNLLLSLKKLAAAAWKGEQTKFAANGVVPGSKKPSLSFPLVSSCGRNTWPTLFQKGAGWWIIHSRPGGGPFLICWLRTAPELHQTNPA